MTWYDDQTDRTAFGAWLDANEVPEADYDEASDEDKEAAWEEYVNACDTAEYLKGLIRSLWSEWDREWRPAWVATMAAYTGKVPTWAERYVAFRAWAKVIKDVGLEFEAIDDALHDPTDDRYPYM